MSTTTAPHDSDEDLQAVRSAEQNGYDREFAGITGDNYDDSVEHPLGDREKNAADDTVGHGFTAEEPVGKAGKKQDPQKFLNKLKGSSKLKQRVLVAGAAAGGSVIVAIIVFLAMLPLKINSIVNDLEAKFVATSENAVGTETENLLDGYVKNAILPSIASGKCHKTIDPSCTVTSSSSGPVGQLYAAWSKGKLEQKLATKYGIIIGKNADGNFVMNLNGKDIDLSRVRSGEISIFDLDGTKQVGRSEIRTELRNALKGGTLWDRTYTRFKVGKFLENQYGIKRCVIACDTKDKFSDSVINKKLAAKAYLLQRLVPAKYGVVMGCLLQPNICEETLGDATPGEDVRLTPAQRQIQSLLESASSHFSEETLAKLVANSNDIAKDGFAKVFAREGVKKLVGAAAGDAAAEAAGSAAEKAVPVVGWALLAVQLVVSADTIGPIIQHVSYATNAATAVEMYSSYRTVASEAQSGHIDPAELGSFTTALSTNLSGANKDRVDATQTPLYNSLVGSSGTAAASIFSSLLPGTASAATTSTSPYTCNDGTHVPLGKLVCPEEKLDAGNQVASTISAITDSIPVLPTVAGWIGSIVSDVSSAIMSVFSDTCNTVGVPFGCPQLLSGVSSVAGKFFNWVTQKLIVTPLSPNMSGGRTADLIAAGADVAQNKTCQVKLGCAKISALAASQIQSQQFAEARQEFDSQPMFARMFDTSSSYSLVSKLAVAMPTSLSTTSGSIVSTVFSNPLTTLGNVFSSAFRGQHTSAITPADDPFGVIQYGYTSVPGNPEKFWNDNCVTGPLATYDSATKQLDVSNWLNTHQTLDPNTGEATNTETNGCLLVQSAIQSAGAIYDPTLLPQGSGNDAVDAGSGANAGSNGLPLNLPTVSANQVITVVADSVTSTKATLQAWDKVNGTWTKHGDAIQAYVGSQGLTGSPKEGLNATPIGSFSLTQAFGAKDNPGTKLRYFKTDLTDWWDENPISPTYNQHVRQSTSPGGASEQLATITPAYDYAVVINANMNPITPGDGSGFFLHVSQNQPTAGCVSIPESDLSSLMQWLDPAHSPRILIGTQQATP